MGRRNGERFLDRRREGLKKKADAPAEAVGLLSSHHHHHWLPTGAKGSGKYPWIVSPEVELLGAPAL